MKYIWVLTLFLNGCIECEEAPDSYNGAPMTGYFDGEYTDCAHYDSSNCSYTLCQDSESCGEWYLESWYC